MADNSKPDYVIPDHFRKLLRDLLERVLNDDGAGDYDLPPEMVEVARAFYKLETGESNKVIRCRRCFPMIIITDESDLNLTLSWLERQGRQSPVQSTLDRTQFGYVTEDIEVRGWQLYRYANPRGIVSTDPAKCMYSIHGVESVQVAPWVVDSIVSNRNLEPIRVRLGDMKGASTTSWKRDPGHNRDGWFCWTGPSGTRYACPGTVKNVLGVVTSGALGDAPPSVVEWLEGSDDATGTPK
jgi:hypothetical protein